MESLKKLTLLILIIYQPFFGQEDSYVPKFKPLRRFEKTAPQELLKSLDSIFNSRQKINLHEANLNDYLYDVFEEEPFGALLEQTDCEWLDTQRTSFVPKYWYYVRNKYYDKTNPNWVIDTIDGTVFHKFADGVEEYFDNVKDLVYFDYNGSLDYNVQGNREIVFDGFILERGSVSSFPPAVIENSLINAFISPSLIRNSIVLDGSYWHRKFYDEPYRGRVEMFPSFPYSDYCSIQSCYLQKFEVDGQKLETFSVWNTKVDTLVFKQDSINVIDLNFSDFQERKEVNDSIWHGFWAGFDTLKIKPKWGWVSVEDTYSKEFRLGSPVRKLTIQGGNFLSNINIDEMVDSLSISNVGFEKLIIKQSQLNNRKKSKIFLHNIDFKNIETRWLGYELYNPNGFLNDEEMNSIYLDLLSNFRERGYDESFEELDKQYKSWKYSSKGLEIIDWIDRNWWDYGYNKLIILRNTAYLFFFFTILNSFILRFLSKRVYIDKKINKAVKSNRNKKSIIRWIFNIPASLFYTSKIFFGLGFKYDNLVYEDKLNNLKIGYLIYFFLIFVSGLVCLGYIINVIVTI